MITIIITAYGEPKATEKAVRAFLQHQIQEPYKIIVADPFPEVKDYIVKKFKDTKNVEFFLDPGEGKSAVLNILLQRFFSEQSKDILVWSDGDVFVSSHSLSALLQPFTDKKVGVVCGHPTSLNKKNNTYGYWSHLLFDEMNKTRKKLSEKKEFFEVSGYLFAMRNGIIKEIPVDASEDNIIPSLFKKKGYLIQYVEDASVFVLNPQNFKDWVNQKKRNIKGHIALKKIISEQKKRKNTLFSEALRGLKFVFFYPKNVKEFYWTLQLLGARLYVWMYAYYEVYFKKTLYKDGWRETEITSTKPLD